ncbi:MAG: 50S ribosomal protein L37ae [Candidatus Aenigmatarchaeota archaeon]
MGRTKKVGTAGRFRAGYGKKIREKIAEIEKIQKQKHICPYCGRPKVKRVAKGIWECKKCGNKFTGLCYYPKI